MPLDERIFVFFKDEIGFTVNQAAERFPDENKRAIYRAMARLQETNRIQLVGYKNKQKIFTARGSSNLPRVKNSSGSVAPISVLLRSIPTMYDENGRIKSTEVDRFFILACQIFVIAQNEEPKADFLELHKELVAIRAYLVRMTENVDNILRHPAMMGDMELFRRNFATGTDPALPTPEELLAFRRWLAKLGTNE